MEPVEVANALAGFGLVGDGSARFVARGAMGEIYRVNSDHGEVALKRLFEWNTGASAVAEAAYAERASAAGVTVPVMLPAVRGGWVVETGAVRWRANAWIDGLPIQIGRCLEQAGRTLRLLHDSAMSQPGPMDAWFTAIPPQAELIDLAHSNRRMRQWIVRAYELEAALCAAPMTGLMTCHGDFAPSNVLKLSGGTLAVLDLEDVGPMLLDHELGYVLLDWCESSQQVRTFRRGYGSGVTLTLSSFGSALRSAINFLAAQAPALVAAGISPSDRQFASAAVERLLSQDWRPPTLQNVMEAWGHS